MIIDAREVEPGVFSVLCEGHSYEVRVDGDRVWVNGQVVPVTLGDRREWNPRNKSVRSGGAESILAPMPGKIVRLLVNTGDLVSAGQGILVIEAMKMQNELKATRAGTIMKIAVKPNETVIAGTILAILE